MFHKPKIHQNSFIVKRSGNIIVSKYVCKNFIYSFLVQFLNKWNIKL